MQNMLHNHNVYIYKARESKICVRQRARNISTHIQTSNMGLTLCSENCHIKTTSRVSELFRTAVGHTVYDRTINQEIREELNIHYLGKNYSGIQRNIGAHYVRNGRYTLSQVSVLMHFNRQKKHGSFRYKMEKPTPMMKENSKFP